MMIPEEIHNIAVIGISHRDAPVPVREHFVIPSGYRRQFFDACREAGCLQVIPVFTCNRTELIAVTDNPDKLLAVMLAGMSADRELFRKYGVIRTGRQAVEHVYRMALGLESQVPGDVQIIKQVKQAYEQACSSQMAGSVLHRLMQSVFRAHKRSRTETDFGSGSASIAYAAVLFAKRNQPDLQHKKVLLVGTGKIGRVTCKNLLKMGVRDITLINRSRENAEKLGNRYQLSAMPMSELPAQVRRADVIIAATGADRPVITKELFSDQCQNEHHKSGDFRNSNKVLIDLSLPRNVDPEVDNITGVEVIHLDMLQLQQNQALRSRMAEIPAVEKIISDELQEFAEWLHDRRNVPAIRQLRDRLESVQSREMSRWADVQDEQTRRRIQHLTHRICRKILAQNIQHIRA